MSIKLYSRSTASWTRLRPAATAGILGSLRASTSCRSSSGSSSSARPLHQTRTATAWSRPWSTNSSGVSRPARTFARSADGCGSGMSREATRRHIRQAQSLMFRLVVPSPTGTATVDIADDHQRCRFVLVGPRRAPAASQYTRCCAASSCTYASTSSSANPQVEPEQTSFNNSRTLRMGEIPDLLPLASDGSAPDPPADGPADA